MTRIAAYLLAVSMFSSLQASPAVAQGRGSVELGLDAAIAVSIFDDIETFFGSIGVDNATQVALPAQYIRAGIFVGEQVQVEPSLVFALASQGGETASALGLGLGFLYNFNRDPRTATPFLKAGGELLAVNNSVEGKQFGIGADGGVKVPLGERWALRLQAGVARRFETDDFLGSWDLSGKVGFSGFTR